MFLGLLPPVAASCLDVLYYTFTRAAVGIALVIFTAVTVPLLIIIPLQLHRISYAPRDVPWVGQSSNTWWSKLKSTLLALRFERTNLEEGWEKVCLSAQQFSLLSTTAMVTDRAVQQQRQAIRPTFAPLALCRPAA